eukprot:426856-Amphidinium_carterae.6
MQNVVMSSRASRPTSYTVAELRSAAHWMNRVTMASSLSSGEGALGQAVLAETRLEVERCWIVGPLDAYELKCTYGNFTISKRFGLRQSSGLLTIALHRNPIDGAVAIAVQLLRLASQGVQVRSSPWTGNWSTLLSILFGPGYSGQAPCSLSAAPLTSCKAAAWLLTSSWRFTQGTTGAQWRCSLAEASPLALTFTVLGVQLDFERAFPDITVSNESTLVTDSSHGRRHTSLRLASTTLAPRVA